MKFHSNTQMESSEPNFHKTEKEDLKISFCDENYLVVHFDYDKNDLYLNRTRGGGVISYEEKAGVFLIGIYSEILKMQNYEGNEENQNLGLVIQAVDHARRYIAANQLKL